MQTIRQWEEENNKPYPLWACIWCYDGYGETWETCLWIERKDYFEEERKRSIDETTALWDYQFEPMVCLPTDKPVSWGDKRSIRLVRDGVRV